MKILHIAYSCVPGQFRGGISKVVYELSHAQSMLGHQVTIFATNYNSAVPTDVPLFKPTFENGFEIRYFPITHTSWFRSPTMQQEIMNIAKQFDILHSHNTFLALNLYATEAHIKLHVPLYFHVHGALDPIVVNRGFFKSLRKRLYINLRERYNYNQARGIFALSQAEVQHLRHYKVKSPIYVIPNGISFNKFTNNIDSASFRQKFNLTYENSIILYLGRITPKKGVHLLVRAFLGLRSAFPKAKLVIAGDRNEDRSYVQAIDRIVEAEHATQYVIWTGFLSEAEKPYAFAAADIFSHVSESEGMAMAILEAMAAGLPTVVSKECYMVDAVHAKAVIEVNYDIGDLQTHLANLLNEQTLRQQLGQTASRYVRHNHDWLQIAKQIVQIYDNA